MVQPCTLLPEPQTVCEREKTLAAAALIAATEHVALRKAEQAIPAGLKVVK